MDITTSPDAVWVHTQVFPSWSVTVPRSLTVTDPECAEDEGYWHARDAHRSVSLTSLLVVDASNAEPIPASMIIGNVAARVLPRGRRIQDVPAGLPSRAVYAKVAGSQVAAHALQGLVAAEGVALVATITSDDEAWCRKVWMSIRHTPEVAARMDAVDRFDELVGARSA
jgi:hypothetical protein